MEHTKDATNVSKLVSHLSCLMVLIIQSKRTLQKTKELVTVAHQIRYYLSSAEVGSIGGEEDGVIGMGECADPNECKAIADLGVDMLAAGIGNIHGKYPANWQGLSFETLACNSGE